jgi:hypothetical protein
MSLLTPTTKLEAVNTMLSAIREAPVNSLASGLIDAETAEQILDNVSRSLQDQGHPFNRETDYTIAPDNNGEVVLPLEFIKADLASTQTQYRSGQNEYVLRGRRMYDTVQHTFNIGKELSLDVVVLLPFDQLPESARRYIAIKAARMFQERILGSDTLSSFQRNDELQAHNDFMQAMGELGDYNIYDSYDTGAITNRRMRYNYFT